ncbi:hypothetical protein, partial [Vibrio cholerae]|uniref:hypothetical protein n=1 Tax=Vibrio cholerae TaxID=666 RepID=UPI0021127410
SLKARGNYRLSPIPVLILYDVQSSQTVQLFLLLFLSFCVYPTSVLYPLYRRDYPLEFINKSSGSA